MARLIQAIAKYGPRVEPHRAVPLDELAEWLTDRTHLQASQITMILTELHHSIVEFASRGEPVNLPGIGIFGLSIDRHGRRNISYVPDRTLRARLNDRPLKKVPIRNRANIDLDDGGYKALWDAEHPDDAVEL